MAKNTKFELDDYGFDTDLDMPDFDFGGPNIKDDRKPMTKIKDGAFEGAKEVAKSPEFIRRVIKTSLPRGYGSAIDLADQSVGSLKNLYNTTVKELKPALNDLKKTTEKILPKAEKYLPKSVADRIKKWAVPEKEWKAASRDDMREMDLRMQLGDIFKYQAESHAKDKAENDVKDQLREGIEHIRHKDQLGQFDSMRISLARLAGYQDKVTAQYHRKSLELQYRHYFVAMDMLEHQQEFASKTLTNLEGILKNTGLPDIDKMHASEKIGQFLKNRFMQSLGDGLFDKRRNFVRNIGEKVNTVARQRVSNAVGQFRMGLEGINMGMDLRDAMGDLMPSISPHEEGGRLAGKGVAYLAGHLVGEKAKKFFGKKKGVNNIGDRLQFGIDNLPQHANEWAKTDSHWLPRDQRQGWEKYAPGWALGFMKDVVHQAIGGQNNTLNVDHASNMMEPTPFNRQASKSITEIIPGFLARIYQELQILRTGDPNVQLTTYDFSSNRFSSRTKAQRRAFRRIVNADQREGTTNELDALIDQIAPGRTLTAEQRKALGQHLLHQNLNTRLGSAKRMSDASTYTGAAAKHAKVFAGLFQQHFATDGQKKEQAFNHAYNRLGDGIEDSRAVIQELANLGMTDFLEEAGIIDAAGNIDMKRLQGYYYGDKYKAKGGGIGDKRMAGMHRPIAQPPQPQPAPVVNPQVFRSNRRPSTQNLAADNYREIVEAIQTNSSRSLVEAIGETLKRIEARLTQGILTYDAGQLGLAAGTGMSGRGGIGGGGEGGEAGGGRWWNRSVKDVFSGAVGKGAQYGKSALNQINKRRKQLWGVSSVVGGFGLRQVKKGIDRAKGFNDVYVYGETLPRMTAWKLKAGLYRDQATGRVLRSYKDITGAVVDEDDNVVLEANEARKAYVKFGLMRKGFGALTSIAKTTLDGVAGVYAQLPKVAAMGFDMARKAIKATLFRAEDVYVRDKDDPVLLAVSMKAGYYRSKNNPNKVIRSPHDIDGPVIDQDNNVVLSVQDLATGLYDKHGKPLRVGWQKVAGAAFDAAKIGFNLLKKGFHAVKRTVKGLANGALGGLNWLANFVLPDGIAFAGGKTIIQRLTEIRDTLWAKFGKPDHERHDDRGADGVRRGSYEDLMRRRHEGEHQDAAHAQAGQHARGKSLWQSGKEKVKSLWDKLRNKGDGVNVDIGGGQSRAERAAARKAERAAAREARMARRGTRAPKGILGKLGRGVGRVGRGLWGVTKGVGKLGLGLLGLGEGAGLAGLGSTALGIAGGIGEAAVGIGGAAAAGISGIAGLAGTALAGIGSIISAPVVLGALAIGGLGYLAYHEYTKKRLGIMSKIRYAQYGFSEGDTDHLQKVFGLEDDLAKAVTWVGGKPNLDEKKVDIKKVIKNFGVDVNKPEQLQSWVQWFALRFKPVFLTHLAALKQVAPDKSLGDVDKLKPEDMQKYFDMVKFPEGPYDVTASPFPDIKALQIGKPEVQQMVSQAAAELAKLKPDDKKDGLKMAQQAGVGLAAGAAVGAAAAAAKPGADGDKSAAAAADAAKGIGIGVTIMEHPDMGNTGLGGGSGPTATATLTNLPKAKDTGKLDALACVRYKTYGLTEMVTTKIRALDMLEAAVSKDVAFDSSGLAQWSGSADTVFAAAGAAFGIAGKDADGIGAWRNWFFNRFLPTYLNYRSVLMAQTNKKEVQAALTALKPQQAVDVAMSIYTSKSGSGLTNSVWGVSDSPWPGYKLNTDVSTVQPNVQALKEVAKKLTMDETKGNKQSAGLGADNGGGNTAGGKGLLSRTWDKVTDMAKSVGGAISNGWDKLKSGVSSMWDSAKNALGFGPSPTGAPGDFSGGQAITAAGQGTGGRAASLPDPKGPPGKWASVKDLIEGAARMAGVDPKMMATMGAIESGFNWAVKAGTSSATGLYQFIKSTWEMMLKKYGPKYGIGPGASPQDPKVNAVMGAEYLKENMNALKGVVKRPLTDTDLYIAHFLGAGGAKKLLTADPQANAVNLLPAPAQANKSIFYNGSTPRTVGQVYQEINRRVRTKGKQFGIDSGGAVSAPTQAASKGKPTAAAAAAPAAPTGAGNGARPAAAAPAARSAPVGWVGSPASEAVAAAGSGFQPSIGARSINAQAQAQQQAFSDAISGVSTQMERSVTIQQKQLDILQKLLDVISSGAGGLATQSSSGDASEDQSGAGINAPQRPMTKAPISMRKAHSY